MNVDLSSATVGQITGSAILAILAAVFGKPILGAWRARRTKEELAGEQRAKLDESEFRRTDDAADRWAHRLERAEKARDEALELVRLARDDVHAVKNAAMVEIHAARKEAQTEIQRIQHAAEAKLLEAEHRIESLMDQVRDRDARIEILTTQHADCVKENARLYAQMHARMDAQGFDPSKTATSNDD